MRRPQVQSIPWEHGRSRIKFKLMFLHFCRTPFLSPSSLPRRDCKFSSKNMSHRRLRGNRKVKGLLISSHLNLKRPRKWRISSEFWAPSNWPALKRTCLLLVHMLETTSQLFLIPPLFTRRDSLNAQPDHTFSDVFLSLPFKGRAFSLFYRCFQSGSLHCYILTVRLRTITIQKQQYK